MDTLTIAPLLLAKISAAAEVERRPVGDVLRDVIERGLEDLSWQRVLSYGAERAGRLGFAEADVPRLIAETRRERGQERAGD